MASITELQLQGSSTVYQLNDVRITTTAVTTTSHILATNSGVTSIAPITIANLAEVLGVNRVTIDSSHNVDDCTKLNTTYIWGKNAPTNAPFAYGTMVVTFSQTVHSLCQICIYRAGGAPRLVYRLMDADVFGPWFEISKTQLP